jgi:hypothetical protein
MLRVYYHMRGRMYASFAIRNRMYYKSETLQSHEILDQQCIVSYYDSSVGQQAVGQNETLHQLDNRVSSSLRTVPRSRSESLENHIHT